MGHKLRDHVFHWSEMQYLSQSIGLYEVISMQDHVLESNKFNLFNMDVSLGCSSKFHEHIPLFQSLRIMNKTCPSKLCRRKSEEMSLTKASTLTKIFCIVVTVKTRQVVYQL